jgi:hypothetical protein
MPRRGFLRSTAALGAGYGLTAAGSAQTCVPQAGTVRDRLWVFCNPIDADYKFIKQRSVMSPLENAVYLGAPNLIMVNQYSNDGHGCYQPWTAPFEQYTVALEVEKRVAWSIVGAEGITHDTERTQVIEMARHTPNIVGVYMDDFFESKKGVASLTLEQLRAVQKDIKKGPKPLDLFVTLYTHNLDKPIRDYLGLIDVITLWTWETAELANLDANLARVQKLAPKSRILLGCFTTTYDEKRTPWWAPLPVATMQHQCEFALRALREKRIEGFVIYGNFFDLGWDCVKWTRKWIQQIGDTKI